MKKIKPSKKSKALSDRLRSDSDSIHSFVSTQIERSTNYADYISKEELYEMYTRFCMKEDRQPHKRIHFNRSLEAMGFVCMQNGDQSVYIGLKKLF